MEKYLSEIGLEESFSSRPLWRKHMKQEPGFLGSTVVAVDGGRVLGIGGVGLTDDGEHHAWISVSKSLRGNRFLLFRTLKDAIGGVLNDLDGKPLYVTAKRKHTPARRLISALGFKEVREEDDLIVSMLEA